MATHIQKAILTFVILSLLSFTASATDLPKHIIITMKTGDHLPYQHDLENGQVAGLYVDVVKEAAKKIGISVTFNSYPWKRCLFMVERGKADAVIGVLKNKYIQQYLYFVEEPLAFEETTLFTYKGSNIKFNGNLSEINQYSVCIIRGATFYDEWEDNKKNLFKIEETNQLKSLIKILKAKRVDLIIGNKFIIQYNLKKLNLSNEVISIAPSLALNSGHLAFSKIKGGSHKNLAEAFNKAIEEIKASDMYMNILNKYVDF